MESVFKSILPGKGSVITPEEKTERRRALEATQNRLGAHFTENQFLGRKAAIGCVSLEISQRCNLDCTLCYLSEHSSQVRDLPLDEILNRLDDIRRYFGAGTNVQISGGDPTLRDRVDLIHIVGYARKLGLHTTLMTNGILCSRELLMDLSQNGLSDVAFHVDLTQQRKGYKTEQDLNIIRKEYMDRARGLPLMVIFNTTVFRDNVHEVPQLARFFVEHADAVGMVSFQLQAETGRGSVKGRPDAVSLGSVAGKIDQGAGSTLPWDAVRIGHPGCHKYAPALAVDGQAFGLSDDPKLFADFWNDFGDVQHDRRQSALGVAWTYIRAVWRKPRWIARGLRLVVSRFWSLKHKIWKGRGRVHAISFFIQNFMHADHLDPERIEACSFMVMTPQGPVSMCAHNAKRDDYILSPLEVKREGRVQTYHPLGSRQLAAQKKTD